MSGSMSDARDSDVPADAPASQRAKELIGRVIAERYRIENVVAMGGIGAVYRGEHVHMRKRVAIKILHPETEGLPELVTRFERESIVGAHASHPNVAAATDFGKLRDGSYYLVLEYVEGMTLYHLMRRQVISIERAVDIAKQIARGLDAVHKLNIFHRDLKPRNVMVSEQAPDKVKLIDFGFAKVPLERFAGSTGEAGSLTSREKVFGTIGYMAPETAFGMHAVTYRSDLYALGVILYEMLSGKHPFEPADSKALFRCHMMETPIPFSKRAPERAIPRSLEKIVMRLLEKAPEDRFDSAQELIDALEAAKLEPERESEPAPAPAPAPVPSKREAEADESPPPAHLDSLPIERRFPIGWALVALLGVVAVVLYIRPEWRDRIRGLIGSDPEPTAEPTHAPTTAPTPPPPSAVPSASAAPPPKERPTTIDGWDATKWRAELRDAAAVGNADRGTKALFALAAIDPKLLGEKTAVGEAARIGVAVALGDAANADKVFALFASEDLAGAGPDILHEIVSSRGGSAGAQRAKKLLEDKQVLARATPGLRILLDLDRTPCKDRVSLLDRAVKEGDDRTLAVLSIMSSPSCATSTGACCLQHEIKVHDAARQLRERLRAP
jgi:serine/threonine-protein kinase